MAAGSDQPDPGRARRALGRGRAVRRCESAAQFRVPPPPALDSAEYAAAFNEVKRLGGDGVDTPTERTAASRRTIGDLLGLRRHAEPVRAAAALQPDRRADRRAAGHGRRSSWRGCWRWSTWRWPTPASRSGSRSTTTSSGGRSPASARPTRDRPDRRRRRQPGDGRRSDLHRRSARRPATSNGPNFTPPFPAYPSGHAGLRRRAVPDPAPLLRHRPASRSRSCRTSSTA